MPKEQEWWWYDDEFGYYYGAQFECCDFEKLCNKIDSIVREAQRRIMNEELSHCCKAPKEVSQSDENTACYVCAKCKQEFLTDDEAYHISESEELKYEVYD